MPFGTEGVTPAMGLALSGGSFCAMYARRRAEVVAKLEDAVDFISELKLGER